MKKKKCVAEPNLFILVEDKIVFKLIKNIKQELMPLFIWNTNETTYLINESYLGMDS